MIETLVAAVANCKVHTMRGRVRRAVGQVVEVEGVDAPVGAELETVSADGKLRLEVLGFRDGLVLAAPLGATAGVSPGAAVRVVAGSARIEVSDAMLGRILDAFGRPIDGKPLTHTNARPASLRATPPPAFGRKPVTVPFASGVRAIDALLPLGVGQRVGLFAGTGVGKSTLLGMMCRGSTADVVVVGLIGERGREVGDFVRTALGPEGLAKSVVVVATGDAPPLVRVRGALTATAIAERFRAEGKSVLLLMDSVTRFAMALREASLAAGEPPVTKGYTPTVFAALPALLERAGNDDAGGSITALYTVLVDGDDLQDPIADTARGILDGHIVLSRAMADRGLFPAIDVLKSVSRVAIDVASADHRKAAARVRELLGVYEEAADLIRLGAYVPGSDPRVDLARAALPRIDAILRQNQEDRITRQSAVDALAVLAKGLS